MNTSSLCSPTPGVVPMTAGVRLKCQKSPETAMVPVVPGVLDWRTKTITLAPPVWYEGEVTTFMDRVRQAYAGAEGLRPEQQGPIRVAEEG